MPARTRRTRKMVRRHGGMRRRRTRRGGNLWGDIVSFGKKANQFLKDTKLISTLGKAAATQGIPYASEIAGVAGTLGYGKRRRTVRRRRRRGRGVNPAGGSLRLAGRGKKTLAISY